MERRCKGIWIPIELWENEDFSFIEKTLVAEINSFCDYKNKKYCYASNQYFSSFIKCSNSSITNAISRLIKINVVELVKFDGRKRFLKLNDKFRQLYKL